MGIFKGGRGFTSAIQITFLFLFFIVMQACSSTSINSCVFTMSNPDPPNNNEVIALLRNTSDGTLSFVGRFSTGGFGNSDTGGVTQDALNYQGNYLYVVNPGVQPEFAGTANEGQGSLTSFRINEDCSLESLGLVASGGTVPGSIAIFNDLLYVANQGNVPFQPPCQPGSYSGFRIAAGGTLSPIEGSTITLDPEGPNGNSPADIVFSRDGTQLAASQVSGENINIFAVDANGLLQNQQTIAAGGGPLGIRFSPVDPFLLLSSFANEATNNPAEPTLNLAPGVGSFRVTQGEPPTFLNNFTDASDPDLVDPCWITIAANGKLLWSSSPIPRSLNLFSVGTNGELSLLSAFNPMDVGPSGNILESLDITLSPDNAYLYQLRAGTLPPEDEPLTEILAPRIDVHRITGNTAVNANLETIQQVTLPENLSDTGTMGIAVANF